LLIAVSVGWLKPAGSNENMMGGGASLLPATYHATLSAVKPVVAGQVADLRLEILDQNNQRFTLFQPRALNVAAIRLDLQNMATAAAFPDNLATSGAGGGMGMSSAPVTTNPADKGLITPKLTFPAAGQYVVFVNFWTQMGTNVTVTVPFQVGGATTPAAALPPDSSLTQAAGDLKITLKPSAELKAGKAVYLTFEAVDAKGQVVSDVIQTLSGVSTQVVIADSKLTTFLMPDFVNRHQLKYVATFPKAGVYKIWFTFNSGQQLQQVEYVVQVK
jgi:hypothetical protein